jgi:hypothetical protein
MTPGPPRRLVVWDSFEKRRGAGPGQSQPSSRTGAGRASARSTAIARQTTASIWAPRSVSSSRQPGGGRAVGSRSPRLVGLGGGPGSPKGGAVPVQWPVTDLWRSVALAVAWATGGEPADSRQEPQQGTADADTAQAVRALRLPLRGDRSDAILGRWRSGRVILANGRWRCAGRANWGDPRMRPEVGGGWASSRPIGACRESACAVPVSHSSRDQRCAR